MPRSGSWSIPDTMTGLATKPTMPKGVERVRDRVTPTGATAEQRTACRMLYSGQDRDGIHWWVPVPVDGGDIQATDRIMHGALPQSTRIQGSPGVPS